MGTAVLVGGPDSPPRNARWRQHQPDGAEDVPDPVPREFNVWQVWAKPQPGGAAAVRDEAQVRGAVWRNSVAVRLQKGDLVFVEPERGTC